jgi:hypothetical protein
MSARFLFRGRCSSFVSAFVGPLVAMAVAPPSIAVQLEYEPFQIGSGLGEYELGPLHGQPDPPIGPLGFFTGNWVDNAEQPSQVVQSTSITPAWTLGGSVTAVGDGGRAGRYLAEPWDDTTTGTYYLSFLVNFGASADPNDGVGYRAVEFWPAGATIGEGVQPMYIGYNQFIGCPGQCVPEIDWSKRMRLSVGLPTNLDQLLTDYPFNEDGANHHMVIKFALSDQAASDTISLYLDPGFVVPDGVVDSAAIEPSLATAVASGLDFTLGAVGAISRFGGTGVLPVYDELRIGTEYADVFPPIPDPSSACSEFDYACYLEIINHMNLTGSVGDGDVNRDGRVSIADYRYWKERRTDVAPGLGSLSAQSVPEPRSWLLGGATAVFFAGAMARGRCPIPCSQFS